jgi:hypothetical protein
MSTRSYIGVKESNTGRVMSVYCHSDSYDNLEILIKNYNSLELAMSLVRLGDMSKLGPTLKDCVFYSRDIGEQNERNNCASYCCIQEFLIECVEDYTFLFDDNEWRWRRWSNKLSEKTVKNENETIACQQ